MIDVEIWYYVESESRVVRLSRKVNISAAPFIGAQIDVPGDNITIKNVIFQDGGGIVCIADNSETEGALVYKDAEAEDIIDNMTGSGWFVLSDTKRKHPKIAT